MLPIDRNEMEIADREGARQGRTLAALTGALAD